MNSTQYQKKITVSKSKDGFFLPPQPKTKTIELIFNGLIVNNIANLEVIFNNKRQYRLTLNFEHKEILTVINLTNNQNDNPNIFNEIIHML